MKTFLLRAKGSEVSHPLPILWLTLHTLSGCGSLKLLMMSEQGTDLSTTENFRSHFIPMFFLSRIVVLGFCLVSWAYLVSGPWPS